MNEVRIPADALVLVADGRRARFLRNTGTPQQLKFAIENATEQDNPPTREQGSDRPGRYPGADGVSRSAVEQTDWHQLAEERFAAGIAERLYPLAHARAFDTLVVIAPPKVLGNLRAAFHPEVTARVVAEIGKDLTAVPVAELEKLLS
jgi:protein required for attachment to host cells